MPSASEFLFTYLPLTGILLYASPSPLKAQDPTSVDIGLVAGNAPNSLSVRVRANGHAFTDLVTGLTFTITWDAAAGISLGTPDLACPGGVPLSPSPLVSNAGANYVTYNAFSLALLSDDCPDEVWPADTWWPVMTVPLTSVGACTSIHIVNDAFTGPNNRDFFVSLGGYERTGLIDTAGVQVGNCTLDCLGVVGGPALPGTSCDDGDVCTVDDLWSAACVCAGTLADADHDGTCDANDGCPNDPNKTAPGICGCGVSDADSDGDGTADCNDGCPNDPNKTAPGICGCGVSDVDTDGDGLADCVDSCPSLPGQAGDACDDGDPLTIADAITQACVCQGVPANDDCTGAGVLVVQAPADCPANATTGTTMNATATDNAPTCAGTGTLVDVWYRFNAGADVQVMIDLEAAGATDLGLAVYDACGGTELDCASSPSGPLDLTVEPGLDYWLRVYTVLEQGDPGNFTLCLSHGINTGVADHGGSDWSLAPNPDHGELYIHSGLQELHGDLQLVDMAGRILLSRTLALPANGAEQVLPPFGLTPGSYLLRVIGEHGVVTRPFIVQ